MKSSFQSDSDTPRTDAWHADWLALRSVLPLDFMGQLERELREATGRLEQTTTDLAAMTERAEKAERTVAWLREGEVVRQWTYHNGVGWIIPLDTVMKHLASNPPDGWEP